MMTITMKMAMAMAMAMVAHVVVLLLLPRIAHSLSIPITAITTTTTTTTTTSLAHHHRQHHTRRCHDRDDDRRCRSHHHHLLARRRRRRHFDSSTVAECRRRGGGDVDDDGDDGRADSGGGGGGGGGGIRLNKVFKATHSRRGADELIRSGRVRVNGASITGRADDVGTRVAPFRDVVTLDGAVVRGWEGMNAVVAPASSSSSSSNAVVDDDDAFVVSRGGGAGGDAAVEDAAEGEGSEDDGGDGGDERERRRRLLLLRRTTETFEYVKYHKPIGVTCTTDARVRDNVVDSARRMGYVPRHRVYPVGRLDRETSGLILLTSDGRVVNSVLRGERKMPKVYDVVVDGTLRDDDLRRLRVSRVGTSSPSSVRSFARSVRSLSFAHPRERSDFVLLYLPNARDRRNGREPIRY
jgi:16S rRNA U516 pseudouridylate synthase RsuA-like enzyme